MGIGILGANTLLTLDEETSAILQYADNFLCVLFLVDFSYNLLRAPNRSRYMATWGWIDLLSSIPMFDAFRIGRVARIIRIVRVLRGLEDARAIAHFAIAQRAESAGLAVALVSMLLIVFSSIAVLHFEIPAQGNIQSAEDATWWAISTITRAGYGDRYPITSEGRAIATLLMTAGVGVFVTVSGFFASWFLSPVARDTDSD
jgi:voltage-gated potassium channel